MSDRSISRRNLLAASGAIGAIAASGYFEVDFPSSISTPQITATSANTNEMLKWIDIGGSSLNGPGELRSMAWASTRVAGTHAKVRYRCFLPDLAGFASPRCPDHKARVSDDTEGVGFEPTIPFQIYTRSRRAPSTARPPLQDKVAESVGFEPTIPFPVCLISSQVP